MVCPLKGLRNNICYLLKKLKKAIFQLWMEARLEVTLF